MNLIKYLKIYRHLWKFELIRAMNYRISFFIELVVELGYTAGMILFFQIVYSNVPTIAGWSYAEMIFLIGVSIVTSEIMVGLVYVWNLRVLPEKIKDGDVDVILVKPLHSLFQLSLGQPYFASIITMLPGIFLIGYALKLLPLDITAVDLLGGLIIIVCGVLISYSLMVLISSLSFVFTNAEKLPDVALDGLWFGSNPHQVYMGSLRLFFTILFPVVFRASVPVAAWIRGLQWEYMFLSAFLALLFFYGMTQVWDLLIRNYSSASS
jgi:ABC-2 type transport system permease protein